MKSMTVPQQHISFPPWGRWIAHARKRAGIGQRQLADAIGMTTKGLSLIETGRRNPRPETLRRLCDELGLTILMVPRQQTEVTRLASIIERWLNDLGITDKAALRVARRISVDAPDHEDDD